MIAGLDRGERDVAGEDVAAEAERAGEGDGGRGAGLELAGGIEHDEVVVPLVRAIDGAHEQVGADVEDGERAGLDGLDARDDEAAARLDRAAELGDELDVGGEELGDGGAQGRGVGGGGEVRVAVAVDGREAAAEVDRVDRDRSLETDLGAQVGEAAGGLDEVGERGALRADVDVQAGQGAVAGEGVDDRGAVGQRDAEAAAAVADAGQRERRGGDLGVDAQADGGARREGQGGEAGELGEAVAVDPDAEAERVEQLGEGLGGAVEDDMSRGTAGGEGQVDLLDRGGLEAGAGLHRGLQHADERVGLDRDGVQGGGGEGGADLGDRGAHAREVVDDHGRLGVEAGGAGGAVERGEVVGRGAGRGHAARSSARTALAASWPLCTADSMVAGRPVRTQSPARNRPRSGPVVSGRQW